MDGIVNQWGEPLLEKKLIDGHTYFVKFYVDPNSEFIKKLHEAYIKYTGDKESKLKTIGGGTYARELSLGVAYGVLFPGEEEMAHQTDEFANIENLFKAGAIIASAIESICK